MHEVILVMTERGESQQINGLMQMDDAYLEGEHTGGKRSRGSETKQPFLIPVASGPDFERPKRAVIESVTRFDDEAICDWTRCRLSPRAEVYTDGLTDFRQFIDAGHAQTVPPKRRGRAATEAKHASWVNIALSKIRCEISGAYQTLRQGKYARR